MRGNPHTWLLAAKKIGDAFNVLSQIRQVRRGIEIIRVAFDQERKILSRYRDVDRTVPIAQKRRYDAFALDVKFERFIMRPLRKATRGVRNQFHLDLP